MSPISYKIVTASSSEWKIQDNSTSNHFIINFPMLTKQKLKDSKGNSLLKVFKDSSNPFIKFIASSLTNQIFGLEFNPELNEYLLVPFKSNSCCNQNSYYSWKICKEGYCIYLFDTSCNKLMGKIEKSFKGKELANIQFYRQLNDENLKIVLLLSGCIILNKSKF